MALQLFAHAIMKDEPIKVFNGGRMRRDFTYIDDIIEGWSASSAKPRPRHKTVLFRPKSITSDEDIPFN